MKDTKLKTIAYSVMSASLDCGEDRRPQKVMEEAGINYLHAVPMPVVDGWVFFGCSNIPGSTPSYMSVKSTNPTAFIGRGLTEDKGSELQKLYDES